ncbi:DUF4038 domain-containing protein [Pollutibacter soli]|uniref:apiosidase-like domain-containing protein n=1 Tax=Pollutibacter soli TaxID=3034157 RepID=UPI00301397D7
MIFYQESFSQVTFPLRVSDDKRYLVDKNNKPFPILGRTAWFIISQPEEGYKKFIDNTILHGHNAIEFAVITHWPTGNHAPFNGEGEKPFLKTLDGSDWTGKLKYNNIDKESPDLTTPNEKYWRYADKFLAYCQERGLLVFMFSAYVGYEGQEQGWMKELVANGKEKSMSYGAWIANRYKNQKNIVWMLLGDMGRFNEEQRLVEQALIDGLKSVKDQQSVLYTAESHSGENAADNPHFGDEMTLNGVYTWELAIPVPFLARNAFAHEPVMPAFLLEEPYDEEGPDGNKFNPNATQPVRRFQWWGWLSTIGGYIAGNGYVWPFIDPTWQQHLETDGAKDMIILNKFIQSVDWWKLVPSGLNGMKNIIDNPNNKDTSVSYISAAAAKEGSLLVAYIPPAFKGEVKVDLTVLIKPGYAYWFDPTDGRYITIEKSAVSNKGAKSFIPPGKNSKGESDWVLVVSTHRIRK